MLLQSLYLVLSLALIVLGSEWLIDGSSSIARKFHLSEFFIGFVIVGFGTSMPEFVVSMVGAFEGNSAISLGNVIGSNITNTLLILGITALMLPIGITKSNKNVDCPSYLLIIILFIVTLRCSSELMLGHGLLYLLLFAVFMGYQIHEGANAEEVDGKDVKTWLAIVAVLVGIGCLCFGGKHFVDSAVNIARYLGVSDKFIAVTILAGGTSMPELVTCVVAALKKKSQLAIGNIIGSNVFNAMFIIGCSSLVAPLSTTAINVGDYGVLLLSAVMLILPSLFGKKTQINKWWGMVYLLIWFAYIVWLIYKG